MTCFENRFNSSTASRCVALAELEPLSEHPTEHLTGAAHVALLENLRSQLRPPQIVLALNKLWNCGVGVVYRHDLDLEEIVISAV